MAVKASQTVTISKIIDISAYKTYYKTVSAGSAAPSKPTTYSESAPPSGWYSTEPAYESGKVLYTTTVVVYSNYVSGSTKGFDYSTPCLDSSYTAATQAYNKAENAQSTADTTRTEVNKIRSRIVIDDDSVDIIDNNGDVIASYGLNAIVGNQSGMHVVINPDSMTFNDGENQVFSIIPSSYIEEVVTTGSYPSEQYDDGVDIAISTKAAYVLYVVDSRGKRFRNVTPSHKYTYVTIRYAKLTDITFPVTVKYYSQNNPYALNVIGNQYVSGYVHSGGIEIEDGDLWINNSLVKDFIVASGTTNNGWTWTISNDGRVEAWAKDTYTPTGNNTAFGSTGLYYKDTTKSIASLISAVGSYVSLIPLEEIKVTAMCNGNTGSGYISVWKASVGDETISTRLVSNVAANMGTVRITYHLQVDAIMPQTSIAWEDSYE